MASGPIEQGLDHHRAGRLAEAERCYVEAGEEPNALHLLGLVRRQQGRMEEAAALVRRALDIVPRFPEAMATLAALEREAGRHEEAESLLRRAIEMSREPALRINLVDLLVDRGRAADALALAEAAAVAAPDLPEAWLALGNVRRALEQPYEAEIAYRRALALSPGWPKALHNLGLALLNRGLPGQARTALAQAAAAMTGPAPLLSLAEADAALGEWPTALAWMEQAMASDGLDRHGLAQAAVLWLKAGQPARGVAAARRAIELDPGDAGNVQVLLSLLAGVGDGAALEQAARDALARWPEAGWPWMFLGRALDLRERTVGAQDAYRRALEADPREQRVKANLAHCHLRLVEHREGLRLLKDVSEQGAAEPADWRLYLNGLLYAPEAGPETLGEAHRRFFARFAPAEPVPPFPNDRDPERRLRIGYLSSDLRDHPVARNMEPVFRNHDRDRFEVHCLALRGGEDATTRMIREHVDGFHQVMGLSDAAIAEKARSLGLDLLINLAGHFDENRQLVPPHHPAPVVIGFHDPVTAGHPASHYLISDHVLTPRTDPDRAERALRLPVFYCHAPLDEAPPVGPPPMLTEGRITFGCTNNPLKITVETVALWTAVLRALPGSRLVMRYRDRFMEAETQDHYRRLFADQGVAPERLEFRGRAPDRAAYLGALGEIDILLDTTPFSGSTTSFEALWMGLPVLTLRAGPMAGRWTAAMLRAIRREDLVAGNADDFVSKAVTLAGDPVTLAATREVQRAWVRRSVLCDGRRHARWLERLYRATWRRWCANA